LADSDFDKPAAIDAVLGVDVYGMLLKRVMHGPPGSSTVFG